MKKITLLCCIMFFLLLHKTSRGQTVFNWETATDNGASVTQTVDGITVTATSSQGDVDAVNGGGLDGSTGIVVYSQSISSTSMTFTFNTAVNIANVFSFTATNSGGDATWVFTPTGGSNSAVTETIPATSNTDVAVNWFGVTSFTVTNSGGGTSPFAFDNITLGAACTEPDVPTVSHTPTTVCNGSTTTLNITGSLNDATEWVVYTGSCGGTEVGRTSTSSLVVTPSSPSTTYYVRGEGGCTTPGSCGTTTVNVTALDDASFSYGSSSYCQNASDPSPTITGTTGGTFSSTAGLSIASNGTIDVSASTPNTYTVTYTTAGTCPSSSNVSVTINAPDDAGFSYGASAYCQDGSDPTPTITGLTGGTFSSTAGLSIASNGTIDVSASTPNTYTVTYTTAGTCPNSSTFDVTINALDDASFSYSMSTYDTDDTDPTPTITGEIGGAFSSAAGLSINTSTGIIDLSASTPNTYTVTYITNGTCQNSSTFDVTIEDAALGIDEIDAELDNIQIYTKAKSLFIKGLKSKTNVEIYSIIGKRCFRTSTNESENNFDLSDLSSGIYIVKIQSTGNNLRTKKIIVN
ncbi:T9SS type A sorting domain-containing protein [Tamlana crocina]|uniref:T9SS type A sorting domain-containing protein n=1 Tax=Tamlana crocina TaxID=393006 RepID=A0ABX1DCR8_9FLAO|nr:T9SS type A sorting domain-containing protein [Tamlana crocina]NJX16166.1 T9SS type A sorting domain-containing protein [Tamlana crocina]